jgi:hypothetical protein
VRQGGRLTLAGLPLGAWVLLAVAVGLGLGLEIAFYRARRRDRGRPSVPLGER